MAYSCSPMMKPNVRGPNLAAVRDRLSIRKRSTLRKEYLLLPNDHKELTGDHRVPRPSRVSFAPATRKLAVSALPIGRGYVSIGVSTDATNCRRFRLPFLHGRILDFRGHDSGSPGVAHVDTGAAARRRPQAPSAPHLPAAVRILRRMPGVPPGRQ